jgi:molecular chaperone DnaK (HSP70)
MANNIAIDFGTSNTVISTWDSVTSSAIPLILSDFNRFFNQNGEKVATIPSLIHYTNDGKIWIGNQIFEKNLYQSRYTYRWMKRYIASRSTMKINIHGKLVTPQQAGEDFLKTVLAFALQETNTDLDSEIGFSAPVEAYEHYESWLTNVSSSMGFSRYRLIDEPSAAALGYGASIRPNSVYLIFDFGGGTMHSSVVLMTESDINLSGRRCRVLGKSGRDIGGTTIDQWIYQDFLKRINKNDFDEDIRQISTQILVACETVKETLTRQNQTEIHVTNPVTNAVYYETYTRENFEAILDSHDLFPEINRAIQSSLNQAFEKGYGEDQIAAVLLVGGSSQIPAVIRVLKQRFGKDLVFTHRPLDAVSAGTASFISGVDFFDYIQHDYAIRFVNPTKKDYDYRVLVNRGTPYPTQEPISALTVKASYDGQEKLGIAIFEMGEIHQNTHQVELVFDPTGAARVMPVSAQEQENRSLFWMNENQQTFLNAAPPAKKGEARFRVEFKIDQNKRLTITARDIQTNQLLFSDYPVVKLS